MGSPRISGRQGAVGHRRGALVANAACLAVLMTACTSPGASAPSTGQAPSAAPAATEPKVKRVVFAAPVPTGESNQPRNISQPAMWQISPTYEYLMGLDPETGKLAPQLSTDWKVENDNAIRFKLQKGVQFHNGLGEFTAKDVVHSWQDITRTDATAGYQVVLAKRTIGNVEVVSDYEVVFRLKDKDADLLNMISQAEGGMEMMSKADFDKRGDPALTAAPIAGTAPYQFLARTQGVNITFQRTSYKHWRKSPDFQEFEFRWIAEPSTRLAGLLTGEIHLTSLPNDLQTQAEKQGFKVAKGKIAAQRAYLNFKCCFLSWAGHTTADGAYKYPESPLMDIRVRQALNKAIDRDALNKAFFGGKGAQMLGFVHVTEGQLGYDPVWKTTYAKDYGYDVAAAKQLLADAGYGPGKPLKTKLYIPNGSPYADMLDAIASYWRAVGVDLALSQMDATQRNTLSTNCQIDNEIDLSNPSSTLYTAYSFYNSSLIGNCGGYQNAETDAIYRKVQQELDVEKQAPFIKELGAKTAANFANVPLFWLPSEALYAPTIVADYPWPGSISGIWTHIDNIRAAK